MWGVEKEPSFTAGGLVFLENNMNPSEKTRIECLHNPAIPFVCIHPKCPKTLFRKHIYTTMLIAAVSTVVQIWKQLR